MITIVEGDICHLQPIEIRLRDRLHRQVGVPAEGRSAVWLSVGANVAPHLCCDNLTLVKDVIQIEGECLRCFILVKPVPESYVRILRSNIEEYRKSAEVAIAPLAKISCVVQGDLHLKSIDMACDLVLGGIVEPDLQDLPVYLSTTLIGLDCIKGTKVSLRCINTENIVVEAVFVARDTSSFPRS